MIGKVYQIVCLTTGEKYIGSTTQTLSQRLSDHKSQYKSWKNGVYHFVTSFTILERDNYQIELLEECPNYKERERFYIENTVCVNKVVVGRTYKEWREENTEIIKERRKEYYQDHKEEIVEHMKIYYQDHKEERKEWREDNRDKLLEYKKKYYQKNKDKINESQREQRRLKKKEENKEIV